MQGHVSGGGGTGFGLRSCNCWATRPPSPLMFPGASTCWLSAGNDAMEGKIVAITVSGNMQDYYRDSCLLLLLTTSMLLRNVMPEPRCRQSRSPIPVGRSKPVLNHL